MLLLPSDPATEYITWFNYQFETPSILVKFTYLDGSACCSFESSSSGKTMFDPLTWTVWIDVRIRYEQVTDALGHGTAHALHLVRSSSFPKSPNLHNEAWKAVYSEIRDGWASYVQKTFDSVSSPSKWVAW